MRNVFVVTTISSLCCVSFALNLNAVFDAAWARDQGVGASLESQEEGDANDLILDFDVLPSDLSDEQATDGAESEDSRSILSELENVPEDVSDAQALETFEAEDAGVLPSELESVVEDETQGAEEGDESEADVPDEFQIDQNDILGSAFSGLVPLSDSVVGAAVGFEDSFAVERAGVFSAGVWLKERVEKAKEAREAERAKYESSADAPDAYKTIDDFFADPTESEQKLIGEGGKPSDAFDWFKLARKLANVGRLEFAKRALEESFLAEPGDCSDGILSNDELEQDAWQSGLDDAYVRLERGAFERLCLASFEYWSDASRFDVEFKRLFSGSKSDASLAFLAVDRAGDYGAARFCRLSLDKYADLKIDSKGRIVFGQKSASEKEFDAYSQLTVSYFERVGFGAPIAWLWGKGTPEVGALVNSMKYARAPYVWAELALYYYDESRPQNLRALVGNVLQLQYGRIPTCSQVVAMAYKQALGYYDRSVKLPGETFPKTDSTQKTSFGADAKTFIWRWDAQKQEAKPVLASAEYARLYEAARLARAADKLATENRILNKDARALAIAATSELAVARVGADFARAALTRFEAACPNLTSDDLASAVQYAIRAKRCRGALIPMILLANKGDAALLNATRGKSSVVVQGAACADRRVRYEALRAVFKNLPQRDFSGSQIVVRALEWFASAQGERVVVVLLPESSDFDGLESVVARFARFGYVVKIGKTVHELLVEAQDEADLEFVFLPEGLNEATRQSAVKALRLEQTTAETPVLVGTLDENADVFDLQADKLAGLRFYDSVAPSNASPRLRVRQAKCAACALEIVKKLKSDVIDKTENKSKANSGEASSYPYAVQKSDAPVGRSEPALQKVKETEPKSRGKVNFKSR